MAIEHRECMNCGKELTNRRRGGKYCSRTCYADGRWGKPIQYGKILTRSKAFIETARLCQRGLSQAEAAKLLGLCPHLVSDWFVQHGTDKILPDRVCAHCGKSLNGMKYTSSRKYCDSNCASKAKYAKNHPDRRRMRFNAEYRTRALELYWGGLEGTLIAQHLGVADGTMHSWIHDFGHLRTRCRNPEAFKLLPVRYRLREAKSPKEWQEILRECAPEGDSTPIHLVCGAFDGKGEINRLAERIFNLLKCDPCDGETYAFCSNKHEQISTICWRNGAFCYTKLPKARGAYIWPQASVGLEIEVRKNEFEYLLSLSKKRGPKPYFS